MNIKKETDSTKCTLFSLLLVQFINTKYNNSNQSTFGNNY